MKEIEIHLKVNDNNKICEFHITEGDYGHTDYLYEGDEPMEIEDVAACISEYLE